MESNIESSGEYVPLKDYEDDYEILNTYPFTIRRKKDSYEIVESISHGYPRVILNGKTAYKHRLIALQFIPNPDNLPQVDHWDKDKTNYHIQNLRWVSGSTNCLNRSSSNGIQYEYVDDIDEDAIVVNDYGKHQFEDYYYYDNVFYFYNGIQYRKLHICEKKNGSLFVRMTSTEGMSIQVMYSRFKKLYDLM